MSTQAHVQQVASTIAAIKQHGRTAQEADNAVQHLQQQVSEARKRQRVSDDDVRGVNDAGKPTKQVLDRQGVKALLKELQSATHMQHKAHAKIKQLEGVADRLRAEVLCGLHCVHYFLCVITVCVIISVCSVRSVCICVQLLHIPSPPPPLKGDCSRGCVDACTSRA